MRNPDENTLDNICQNYDYDELGENSNLIVIVCGTGGLYSDRFKSYCVT